MAGFEATGSAYMELIKKYALMFNFPNTMANYWNLCVIAIWRRLRPCRSIMVAFEATGSVHRGIDQKYGLSINFPIQWPIIGFLVS